jgi:N-acyl-D-aspartate/D-glutamate deacylase
MGVRRLTGELADVIGLTDRGYIRPECRADIAVIDLAQLEPGSLRRVSDLPAGGDRLVADDVTGIRHVLVNGVPVCCDGLWIVNDEGAPLPGEILGVPA